MESWLNGLDPSTRYGLLVALVFVLPLGSLICTGLLGHTVGYARDKPAVGRILSVMLVGMLTAALGIAGIVTWVYMNSKYGWFPGNWAWIWGAAWLGGTLGTYETPKRGYGKKRKHAAAA